MAIKIVQIIKVVNVVNHDFEVLAFLEVIGDLEVLHPLWCQVIHDNFGLADLPPDTTLFLE